MRLDYERPLWRDAVTGLFALALFAGVATAAASYHLQATRAAATAEWFNVCAAIGWKHEVCKLSCSPAKDMPRMEVTP